jgi:hypothetical protein
VTGYRTAVAGAEDSGQDAGFGKEHEEGYYTLFKGEEIQLHLQQLDKALKTHERISSLL